MPAIDLFMLSRILDKYSELGKPIYITEVSVPSSFDDSWRTGYWHKGWNQQIQADWLFVFYTICISKPYIKGITWWDANDRYSFITTGGVLDEDNNPKESYKALKKLIASFKGS
jgi:GH35 family endo-1,4-beta-xylanase